MYKTTTFFIKEQTPGICVPLLLDLYKQELEYQEVSNLEVSTDRLNFSIAPYKIFWFKYVNKFSNFKSGQIIIEETDQEYVVTLSADLNRLLNKSGISAGVTLLLMKLGGVFDEFTIFFGLIVFVLAIGIFYIQTSLFFPMYFTRLRNQIEQVLQNESHV